MQLARAGPWLKGKVIMLAGSVETRLARLEVSLHRTRLARVVVTLTALLALAGGNLLARARGEIATARGFHVRDEQGELRAGLGVLEERESLNLWNAARRSTFTAP